MTEGGRPAEARLSVHPPHVGRSTQQASATCRATARRSLSRPPKPNDVFYATRLPFDPGSPITVCAHAAVVAVLRGGVLEPEPQTLLVEKRKLKQSLIASVYFQRATLRVFLSQAGPRFDLELVQAEHHLWVPTFAGCLRKRRGRPGWVALCWFVMRLWC